MLAVISQRFCRSGDLSITERGGSITTRGRLAHWDIQNKKPRPAEAAGVFHIHRGRSRERLDHSV